MTKLLKWLHILDENKDGKLSFKMELLPLIYTIFVGFMVYWERLEGSQYSDYVWISIIFGSLGTSYIAVLKLRDKE
jgi:hypothetical protein